MPKTYFVGHGQGTSMQPIINERDKLTVEKVGRNDLHLGDIVVFYKKGSFVGHRIIKIKNETIITKGDNVPFPDKPVVFGELLGKVTKIEGKYGALNLSSQFAKLITYYFLSYSLITFYLPYYLYAFLTRILRGRKILVKTLSLLNFSNSHPA